MDSHGTGSLGGLTRVANKAEAKYEESRVDLRVADRELKRLHPAAVPPGSVCES